MQKSDMRFDCALTYDGAGHYMEFTDPRKLVDELLSADELISFNGRRCDLLILEKFCGDDYVRPLWDKVHHDLFGYRYCYSLDALAMNLIGEEATAQWERSLEEHREKLVASGQSDFWAISWSDVRDDVDRTYAVFEQYIHSEHFTKRTNTFTDEVAVNGISW